MTMRFFTDEDFQFGLEMVLGGAYRQNTDIGESLATAARIPEGDADAWIREWIATADGACGAGETAQHAGRRVTALSFYRRAATYYSTALYCTAKATSSLHGGAIATAGSTSSTSRRPRASGSRSRTRGRRSRATFSVRPTRSPVSVDRS
jgi:hypothetical protein